MDLRTFGGDTTGSIDQYAQPKNYELTGKRFDLAMDDGIDYTINVADDDTIEWNYEGERPQTATDYICVKGDETTYLLSYELDGVSPRENHTFVLDLENSLVTRIISRIGENPRFPYLITPKYEFGAIRRAGEPLPFKRHGYTSDLVGNVVQWNYGGMETVHVYYCTNFYRITYPPEKEGSMLFNEILAKLPSSDEPTAYIKIKDGMYLFSLTEANMERHLGAEMPYRSNTMCFLQNYKRVYLAGRAFGTTTIDGEDTDLHITFSAYGKILEAKEEYLQKMLTDPNPYIV